ncbi:MAG TPA: TonB-dependent receptor [Vicinamibacterales bacterium]|nr:TonB-dependent receptor [Vicinamibacterales bacterium]
MSDIRKLTAAAIVGTMLLGWPAAMHAQGAQSATRAPATSVPLVRGGVEGVVANEKGQPLAGAIVSATGEIAAFAVTDDDGRFELRDLPAGAYVLRARLSGFTSQSQPVTVHDNARTRSAINLRPAPILAAGFAADTSQADADPAAAAQPEASTNPTDDGELAWRLRHARRGVLKDADYTEAFVDPEDGSKILMPLDAASRAAETSLRLASDFITDTPFSGQVNLLTAGSFESPRDLLNASGLSQGVAYLSLSAPAGSHGDWTVRGAFTQADISAWILSGSYQTNETADRARRFGVSYSTQRYDGGNPLALRELTDGSRNVGEIYGFETFSAGDGLIVDGGARYAQYDYLDGRNLLSPRVQVTVIPSAGFRFYGSVSSRALAPGAEEFLPPSENGIWLPPQRTFSSIEPGRPLTAEHTLTAQVGVQKSIGPRTRIGLRTFHQRTDDQLMTLFGADMPDQPSAKVGHYFVGSAGDAKATGGAASIETEMGERISGSVEYSLASARLRLLDDLRYIVFMGPTTGRPYAERIHDVSATVRAVVPETSTSVLVMYRVGNSFAQGTQGLEGTSARRALDSRFDVQVRQSLPFMDFGTSRWEMLVAVRNFFRETDIDQSIYDELLVVRPPKRVVGGLTMMF